MWGTYACCAARGHHRGRAGGRPQSASWRRGVPTRTAVTPATRSGLSSPRSRSSRPWRSGAAAFTAALRAGAATPAKGDGAPTEEGRPGRRSRRRHRRRRATGALREPGSPRCSPRPGPGAADEPRRRSTPHRVPRHDGGRTGRDAEARRVRGREAVGRRRRRRTLRTAAVVEARDERAQREQGAGVDGHGHSWTACGSRSTRAGHLCRPLPRSPEAAARPDQGAANRARPRRDTPSTVFGDHRAMEVRENGRPCPVTGPSSAP